MDTPPSANERLKPFVPRLLREWLRDTPDERWRAIEGSLAFVDISGFTSMTERLARKGKVGAEEVNDVLDATFAELLAEAYAYGASLVHWGGDAVLLLFRGEHHAPRAARAAYEMRATMRRIGKVQTSAGRIVLRMSIGIHSGTFHFFVVGDRHRELVVSGPGASRCAATEQIAEAGEIGLSADAAALLPDAVIGPPKEDILLLGGRPEADRVAIPTDEVEGVDLSVCLPEGIRELLLSGHADAEHRAVAAAFVEFSGGDAYLEREGPDALADAIDAVVRSTQDAAHRFGPTFFQCDISKDGGKVMMMCGTPTSTGADDERMLLAARSIVDTPNPLSVRVGVNSGHVFCGVFGPPYRRTYSVKGDAVNLAARVMGKAPPGGVVATTRVLERSALIFETTPMEPFLVKGKSEPIHAAIVGDATGARRGDERVLPLVGRDRELETMIAALDRARDRRGAFVELIGEPGLGKSRLIQELRSRAGDAVVLAAACEEYGASTPYAPFRTVLRDLLGIGEHDLADAAAERLRARVEANAPELLDRLPLLAAPLDLPMADTPTTAQLEGEFRRTRLEEVVETFLDATLPTTTILVFEDTHWMDDASASLLHRLAASLRERPWMLCTTRRDVEGGFAAAEDPEIHSLALEPISDEDAAKLATADSEDEPLAPDAMAALTARAAGNPLFLRELVQAARRAGGVAGLPETVEAVITSQVDALPAAERTRLRRLAVLGSRFEEAVAESVLGHPPLGGDVSAAALERYLVREPDGTMRFAHALIRDAAYEGLPFRARREIHARAGAVIEGRAPNPDQEAEILSLHFFASGEAERAWRYSVVAGDRARSLYANVEAAEFYGRALESARRIGVGEDDRARVLTDLGEVRQRLGRYDSAADAYSAARKLVAERPAALADLYRREAWVREAAGRFSDAVRWHKRGLRLLEGVEGEDAQAARAAHMVGVASMRHAQGRARESIDWCHRAIDAAEAVGDEGVIAHACYLLDWLYEELGRPQDAPYPGRALAIYESRDDLAGQSRVLNNLGMFAYFRGDWDDAADLYERGGRAAERMGDAVGGAYATANVAEIQLAQGHLEEAEQRFREALRVWRAASYRQGVAFAYANLGTIAARTGRHEDADRLLGDARAEFQDVGSTGYVVEVDVRTVEDAVLRGAAEQALERIAGILDAIERAGGMPTLSATVLRYRGYALAQLGDLADAREALDRSLVLASEHDAAFEIALTLQALARVGELRGNDMSAIVAEAEKRLGTLGVVWTPSVPLAAALT